MLDKESVTYDDRHVLWYLANSARQLSQGNKESAIQAYDSSTDVYREIYNKRKNSMVIYGNEFEKQHKEF